MTPTFTMVTVVEDEGVAEDLLFLGGMEGERERGRGREERREDSDSSQRCTEPLSLPHLQGTNNGCHKILYREQCLQSHVIQLIHQAHDLRGHVGCAWREGGRGGGRERGREDKRRKWRE